MAKILNNILKSVWLLADLRVNLFFARSVCFCLELQRISNPQPTPPPRHLLLLSNAPGHAPLYA